MVSLAAGRGNGWCLMLQFCTYTRLVVIAQQIRLISLPDHIAGNDVDDDHHQRSGIFEEVLGKQRAPKHHHHNDHPKIRSEGDGGTAAAAGQQERIGHSKGIQVGGTFLVIPFHLFSAIPPFFRDLASIAQHRLGRL